MLKNNFENLPLREKIQLYFIVAIFFILVFVFLQELFFVDGKKESEQKQYLSLKSLSNKIVVKNNKELIDYIETELAKDTLFVQSITTSNQTISLNINGSFDSVIQFLHRVEQHLVIDEFFLDKSDSNTTMIKSRIVFLNHYFANPNQHDVVLKNIKNPFENENISVVEKKESQREKEVQVKSIQIEAIIFNEVFIDGDWYKIGDIFQENKIVQIEPTLVEFVDTKTNKIKTIRLEIDE